MIPVANKPILEYLIEHLKQHGFREIGITLHYLPSSIVNYFGDGSRFGVELHYSIEEDKPLGTAGGVKLLVEKLGWLGETIVVLSGDVLTDLDLTSLIEFHKKTGSVFTMAIRRVGDPTRYGIALLDGDGRVVKFAEKPQWSQVFSDLANMGVYVIEPEAIKYIPSNVEYDFAKNLIPELLARGEPVYGFRADSSYWCDIGDFDEYRRANVDVLEGRVKLSRNHLGREVEPGVFVAEDAEVSSSATVKGPVAIGSGVRVRDNAEILSSSVVGSYSVVEANSVIDGSIIWSHVYIGHSSRVLKAIIADRVKLEDHVSVMEDAVVADETVIKRGAVVKPGVMIWPSKIIDPYTVVSTSIKWGIRWHRSLVDLWGITGIANIEISPEIAVKLGMALGSLVARRAKVAVACDASSSSNSVKYGIIAGLLSTGVDIVDLGIAPLPMLTLYAKVKGFDLAVMVTTLAYDPSRVRIKVFSRAGFIAPDQVRVLESIFFREAYRRVLGEESGNVQRAEDFVDVYVREISSYLDVESVAKTSFLVDCIFGTASFLWSRLRDLYDLDVYQVNCGELGYAKALRKPVLERSLSAAPRLVQSLGLSAGFVFDNDSDKVVVIDDLGRVVNSDKLAVIISKILAGKRSERVVVIPHSYSKQLADMIASLGLRVVFSEHGLAGLSKYATRDSLLLYDDRGGFTYPWLHGGADAFYTALLILEYLGETGLKLSQIADEIPEAYTLRKTYHVPFDKRAEFMRLLYEDLREKEVDVLDGIKVIEEDLGSGYIRLVPGEPAVEIRVESTTSDKAEKMLKILDEIVIRALKKVLG